MFGVIVNHPEAFSDIEVKVVTFMGFYNTYMYVCTCYAYSHDIKM